MGRLQVFSQASVTPNLLRNSYMDVLDGAKPLGFNVIGNLVIEAVHPFTKGFEGPYLPAAPANAASSPEDATQQNPYWYGVYNKGPRATRAGLGDGWIATLGGKILKITGDNTGTNGTVTFPFEKTILSSKVRLRAWIKIVSADIVGFGADAGIGSSFGNYTLTKATTDAAPNGWYFIDQVVNMSRVSALSGYSFAMGLKGSNIEVYLALPYVTVVEDQSWLPSVSDMLYRDGLYLNPVTQNVSIGTTDSKGYKFAVNGDAVFTKIKVKQNTAWPDYVFDTAYKLPALSQLADNIKERHALPGIPTAKEVEENGVDVAAMNAKLLQKLEELTLYLIDQDKLLNVQKQKIAEQEQKLLLLEERLANMEKKQE
jgi:hypothetical protein